MKAQEHFGDILSEICTYGEAFIIVEQKPNELIDSMIINTNLKLCHKLPSIRQISMFKDSLGLLPEHISFIAKLAPGECILKLDQVDLPFLVHTILVKEKDWGITKGYTDEELIKECAITRELKDFNFKIAGKDEFLLEIYELIYREGEGHEVDKGKQNEVDKGKQNEVGKGKQNEVGKGKEKGEKEKQKILQNPTKEDLVKFPNYQSILWKKLKWFYDNFKYCPTCIYCKPSPHNARCSECNTLLKKIDNLKIQLLNMEFKRKTIKSHSELVSLLTKYEILAPSSYSSVSQRELLKLKESYRKLMGTSDSSKKGLKN